MIRMTLTEAIKHCEDIADYDCFTDEQRKCSEEHRQLADWLRELKERREKDMEVIKQLPSARPERTCVNCGRTANNGGWYADGGTRCPIEEHYALPKDGFCHLWEKRNVTDDDYPERRTDEE